MEIALNQFLRQQRVHTAVKFIYHIIDLILTEVNEHGYEIKQTD